LTRPRTRTEVIKLLEKLGFKPKPGRPKHPKYRYKDDKGVKRITVPVPKGRDELPIGTLRSICDRICLDADQFEKGISCTFDRGDYQRLIAGLVESGKW
jgi:predicted RNA binding protein YcfA (HicA-like mRNA interferase family)